MLLWHSAVTWYGDTLCVSQIITHRREGGMDVGGLVTTMEGRGLYVWGYVIAIL